MQADVSAFLLKLTVKLTSLVKQINSANSAKDIAMQIAAANPKFVSREEVPQEELEKEKEILQAQALNEGKPEKIVDKMVEGRISKYYEEYLLDGASFR